MIVLTLAGLASAPGLSEEASDKPIEGQVRPVSKSVPVFLTEPGAPVKTNACLAEEIEPNTNVTLWDSQAATTQCGVLENDSLVIRERIGPGVEQLVADNTAKYGLTPRLEVRWGMPGHIIQTAGRGHSVMGTTDQWLGALYRFHEGGRRIPDLAIDYALKIPMANPGKGFGTGYADSALTFIASRTFGLIHVDFNAAGTVVGGPRGHDGSAQFGVAVTRPLPHRMMGTLETFGGPQPGSSDRYGAVLAGVAWGMRPWLALNASYSRAYTAGSPRDQLMVGMIYTLRPRLASWLALPGSLRP